MLNISNLASHKNMAKPTPKRPARRAPVSPPPAGREGVSPEAVLIGRRIAHFRDAANLSNFDFAQAINRTTHTITKLTSGEACTKFADLATIARALDTTPNDLLGFSDQAAPAAIKASIEASYVGLGLPAEDALELSQIVLSAAQAQPIASAQVDAATSARVQSEIAARSFAQRRKRAN